MIFLSLKLLALGIVFHMSGAVNLWTGINKIPVSKQRAVDLQKICEGQRYGALVPNPNDCSSFYVCQFIIQMSFCDTGLHFDRRNKVCNWPQFANCDWVDTENNSSGELTDEPETDKPTPGKGSQESPQPTGPSEGDSISGEEKQTSPSSVSSIEKDLTTEKPFSWRPTIKNLITEEQNQFILSSLPPTQVVTIKEDLEKISSWRPTAVVTDEADREILSSLPPTETVSITDQEDQGNPSTPQPTEDSIIDEEGEKTSSVSDIITAEHIQVDQKQDFQGINSFNLAASILSVESIHDNGDIDHPIIGAHSTDTGYPIDVMTGYDPTHVQCIHQGLYFLPHPTNCQKYFICAYRQLFSHSCGSGVSWNHEQERCELGQTKCYSREVSEENSSELAKTPSVIFSEETTKQHTRKPLLRTTTLPTTTTSHTHRLPLCPTTHQVYLPDLDDCHKYFICILGRPILTSCPSGMYWDAIGEFCAKPSVARCAFR